MSKEGMGPPGRIDAINMSIFIGEYLDNRASKQMKKSTKSAVNLVNETLREVSRLS